MKFSFKPIFSLALGLVFLHSCGENEDPHNIDRGALYGNWKVISALKNNDSLSLGACTPTMSFNKKKFYKFTYWDENDSLCIKPQEISGKFKLRENKLLTQKNDSADWVENPVAYITKQNMDIHLIQNDSLDQPQNFHLKLEKLN
ncbi:hypothetical protein EDL99_08090 [Ornithobacterium rhinotracheale]|uniref:lipocalin family protein n=1 Tax=Ornithobacterium rhinotracheale TaxID=28251 RepID=UPI00129C3169|nr:lipocalin family protein [Ornithobacterium rhinotracheale]MRJ08823.1 hypothetical protein [Ornithobacterium rhinotracheale]UOH77706.1 lipocalin family protein [Ornithobacterium rhinotracheale]